MDGLGTEARVMYDCQICEAKYSACFVKMHVRTCEVYEHLFRIDLYNLEVLRSWNKCAF
jgi:hypothetical protein